MSNVFAIAVSCGVCANGGLVQEFKPASQVFVTGPDGGIWAGHHQRYAGNKGVSHDNACLYSASVRNVYVIGPYSAAP